MNLFNGIAENINKSALNSEVRNVPLSILKEWSKSIMLPPHNAESIIINIVGDINKFQSIEQMEQYLKDNL